MRTCMKCLVDKPDDNFKSKSVCYSCFKMSHDYSKEVKLSPTVDKSFVDDTYAQMLKKSGRKIALSSVDGHAESIRMTKERPEYTQTMKDLNTQARQKMEQHEVQ